MKSGRNRPNRRDGRKGPRKWGVLLLSLFVLAQALTSLHHSMVQHEVCPVDGELTHGDGHHHEGSLEEASDHKGPVLASTSDEDDHDEHCSFPPTRDSRKHLFLVASTHVEPAPTAQREHCAPVEVLTASIPTYLLAPKQSPPRIA